MNSTPVWNGVHAGMEQIPPPHGISSTPALSLSAHKNFGARHFLVKKLYLYRRKRLIKKNSKPYENA